MTARKSTQGPSLSYQYDLMGRLSGITQNGTSQVSATYGSANEMTNLTYFGYSEARTYNSLLQLTRQTVPGVFDTEYVFPAGQNNGQISSSIDHISGEQANYTYDALKRLTAAGTVGPQWGQAYTYDGFGNLTAATVTQGSGVNWANASSAATNQMLGISYDTNGNNITAGAPCCTTSYDVENRIISQYVDGNVPKWTYDPSGKRVAQYNNGGTGYYTWTLYFYDIFGRPIETWNGDQSYPTNSLATLAANLYFGGKLVQSKGVTVVTDRLGSVRANSSGERFSYLPYGYERTASANARVKFGTYLQDASDQDYADQRYYNPWFGRFNTPDPSKGMDPKNPGTWNRYSYVGGDPVNGNDPRGLWIRYPSDDTTLGGYDIGDGACEFISSSVALYGPNQGDPIMAFTHCLFPLGLAFSPAPQRQAQAPEESCTLSLEYRTLDTSGGSLGAHGYLYFTSSTGLKRVIEGYTNDPNGGPLLAHNVPPAGALSADNPAKDQVAGSISSDSDSWVCGALGNLNAAVSDINRAKIPYNLLGPNSNTAARYMLWQLPDRSWWNAPAVLVAFGFYVKLPGLDP